MINSFANEVTRKIFLNLPLTRKEIRKFGSLNIEKTTNRLQVLDLSDERDLILAMHLYYHALSGTRRYSIDANSRRSIWRITFEWADGNRTDVEAVLIEDTHK